MDGAARPGSLILIYLRTRCPTLKTDFRPDSDERSKNLAVAEL